MKIGVRGKLFLLSITLIASFGLASGVFLEAKLSTSVEEQLQQELTNDVQLAQLALEQSAGDRAALDAIADDLAERSQTRVSLYDLDGKPLGDSTLSPEQLADSAPLPKEDVAAAIAGGVHHAQLLGPDGRQRRLTVAAPFPNTQAARGVVRVELPLGRVDAAVSQLRALFLVAALVGLVVAGFMSMVASELLSRTLRELARHARAIASGEEREGFDKWPDDEVGRLARSVKRISDEFQHTVATLGSERDRLQAILLAMHDAVLVIDESERITLANSAADKLLKLPQEESERSLANAIDEPELLDVVRRGLSGETQATIMTLGTSGRRHVQAEIVPLASMGVLVLMHDVTDLRRLETMRRDFVGNVSHELRTPVSVIRVNAETLLDGALDDEIYARRFVERILRSAERLSHLVTDLLDLSRIEAGRYATKMDRISVLSAVNVVMEDVKVRAAERNLSVEVDVPADIIAQGDATALEQILQNLLDNAISYTPPSGHIHVRAREREDACILIEVEDDGPGIAPEHHTRIFERFYRVDPGRSREMGGTGLGLAIVKHLTESMGGHVGVKAAREEGGTLFWVELSCPPLSTSPSIPGVSVQARRPTRSPSSL